MGYTTGVLRHYFSDKDELLLFSKNMLFDGTHERARVVAEGYKGLDKLRAMALEFLPSDAESVDRYRLLAMFNGNAVGDARLTALQHKRNDSHATLFADAIAALQKEEILPKRLDPNFEASGILSLADGLGEQQIMRPKRWTREALRKLMNRYIDSLAT